MPSASGIEVGVGTRHKISEVRYETLGGSWLVGCFIRRSSVFWWCTHGWRVDENIIEPNAVDLLADVSVPLNVFADIIADAYAMDFGGVAQGSGWSFDYGSSLAKTIHFEPVLAGFANYVGGALSNTDFYGSLSIANGELSFRPTMIENGLPQEQLIGFGVTVLAQTFDYGLTALTGNLSDGSQLVASSRVDGATLEGDTLFALMAPPGIYFTELTLEWESPGPPRLYFDDIGFVTAQVPEPIIHSIWLSLVWSFTIGGPLRRATRLAASTNAVGTAVAGGPPHRSVREVFPHTAPALSRA